MAYLYNLPEIKLKQAIIGLYFDQNRFFYLTDKGLYITILAENPTQSSSGVCVFQPKTIGTCIPQGAATTSLIRHDKITSKVIKQPKLALQVLP